jgi:ribosome-dependent ATPase
MFMIPTIQITLFGYALDTKIEYIPTAILNMDGRRASEELIEALVNTRAFRVTARPTSEEAFQRALTSGRVRVGVRIPPDYSARLVRREQVGVGVLIDGSESQVATTALNASKLLGLVQSLRAGAALPARDASGRPATTVDMRPRLLYNPDLLSERFFVPGLVGIILQLVTLFLTAFAIVRERERGTLEQLIVTPIRPAELMAGKLLPYVGIAFAQVGTALAVGTYWFGVPFRGNLWLLLSISLLFLLAALGMGLLISTVSRTQGQAMQMAMFTLLPSFLISGFMFPREAMPAGMYAMSHLIPLTYFLQVLRGTILKGVGLEALWWQVVPLAVFAVAIAGLSALRFRRSLA